MERTMQYHPILRNYVRDYALPGMLTLGWTFKSAKSIDWPGNRRVNYHIDQSLRTHILNALYGITRVLQYLADTGYLHLGKDHFEKLLVLVTMHDLYKDPDVAQTRVDSSPYSIPLEEIERLLDATGLRDFAPVKAEDIRAMMISQLSPRVGDFSSTTPGTLYLRDFVGLADALASQQTARDFRTAQNYLHEILRAGKEEYAARTQSRMSARTGIPLQPLAATPALSFGYHELDDFRGLSTLEIHQAAEHVLRAYGLYPVLYFANGLLYLCQDPGAVDGADLQHKITKQVFAHINQEAQQFPRTIARLACDTSKGAATLTFRKFAYLFIGAEELLQAAQDEKLPKKAAGFVSRRILGRRVERKKYASPDVFYQRYGIPPGVDMDEAQARRWLAASKMIMAAQNIAEALVPEDSLAWLLSTFGTPPSVAQAIRAHRDVLKSGGIADHCIIVAYHWLKTTSFAADGETDERSWLEVEMEQVQRAVAQLALRALQTYDTPDRRRALVEKEFGFESDCIDYLRTHLTFSFAPGRLAHESPRAEYERERTPVHKRLCVLCNRLITTAITKKASQIEARMAEMPAQVFSNKRRSTSTVKEPMVWCPMCCLEYLLRRLNGQGYPDECDYNASYRLYLYLLPDYSFTPQLWQDTAEELVGAFSKQHTVVSRLVLRGDEQEPSVPTRWLSGHSLDPRWLQYMREMFAEQAERMAAALPEGTTGGVWGDRLTFSFANPNYMLLTYSNAVPARLPSEVKAKLAPTHIEVWTKALYAATLIQLLTGARVYLTDQPYLTITRPEEMKAIIEMEGLHPMLYSLLPIPRSDHEGEGHTWKGLQGNQSFYETNTHLLLSSFPAMLDLLSAIWEIAVALFPEKSGDRRNMDKQVAAVLEELARNPLAGASLYQRLFRAKQSPTATFTMACRLLLPQSAARFGSEPVTYELLLDREGGELMNITQELTDLSLDLYVPIKVVRGQAHRYEKLVRTGIEALRTNRAAETMEDDELVALVAGRIVKRVNALARGYFSGYIPLKGPERVKKARAFAELLMHRLFKERYNKSVIALGQEEDAIAATVFFLTCEQIDARWRLYKEKKKQRATGAAKANAVTSTPDPTASTTQ
jgi:hypothetical protein